MLKYKNLSAPEAVTARREAKSGKAKVELHRTGGGVGFDVAKILPNDDSRVDTTPKHAHLG